MADKLLYERALEQVCANLGLIDQARRDPEIERRHGMTVLKTGLNQSVELKTMDRDIQSAWDPMDGDQQLRARDKLLFELKQLWIQPNTNIMIEPRLWAIS